MIELIPLIFFICLLLSTLIGFPVSFTLGGISVIFALLFTGIDVYSFLPHRLFGTMQNFLFLAIPMFIYMGVMLERSGIAGEMLNLMAKILRKLKGGLALSIIIVGAILGATTGIVGATVTTMGIISLPVLIRYGYSNAFSSGVIVSSGTLGQIIPPSVVLVLLGSTMQLSVGDLFAAALGPSMVLLALYFAYTIIHSNFISPPKKMQEKEFSIKINPSTIIYSFVSPIVLILSVLGSIYAGIASPTEAAGLGAFVATILCLLRGKLSLNIMRDVSRETVFITCMVFTIFFGASAFGLIFRELNGDQYLIEWIEYMNISPNQFLILVLILMFIMGCFIDFVEIIFIFIPILLPVMKTLEVDLFWVSILIAINLQTSFITPPFGFSLFYLKGVAPKEVRTKQIYKGALPFIALQLITLVIVYFYPELCKLFMIN